MSIASNIKELRKRFDLTQAQLAEIAGVTNKAVSTWENGKAIPHMGCIQKMADYFGISKSDIIEDKQEKPIQLDELRTEVFNLLVALPEKDLSRVRDFLAGLQAARAEEEVHRK